MCDDIFGGIGWVDTHRIGIGYSHRAQGIAVDIEPLEVAQPLFCSYMTVEMNTIQIYHFHFAPIFIKQDIST